MDKTELYYIVSFSGGKDSYAMVLELLYRGYPLHEVVNYDTGMGFEAVYRVCNRMKKLCKSYNLKYTTLYPEKPFLYTMFEKPVKYRYKEGFHYGYSWCGGTCRRGTAEKLRALDKYCENRSTFCYIAIASDEKRPAPNKPYKLHPLREWGITEKQALYICRKNGVHWEKYTGLDLYGILDRVSCWCCANKNLKELEAMYRYLPKYWNRLKGLQGKLERPFKSNYSIFDLEERFKRCNK